MSSPVEGEHYRIQNVEYGTFLELSKPFDGGSVTLRVKKRLVEKQQWTFVPGRTEDTLKIRNVSSLSNLPALWLFADEEDYLIATANESEATEWSVRFERNSGNCCLMFKDPISPRRHKFAFTSDNGSLRVSTSRDASFNVNSAEDTFKWNLVNVWPCLPGDIYCIRSLAGHAIYVTNKNGLAVDLTKEAGSHQAWELISKTNAKCELKNVDCNTYLSTTDQDGLTSLKADDMPVVWQLTSVGKVTYFITVADLEGPAALALTLGENGQVTLKPFKSDYNQIWFINPTDVHDTLTAAQAPNSALSVASSPPPYEGERYADIIDGIYTVANRAFFSTRTMVEACQPYRLHPYNYTNYFGNKSHLRITYLNDSPAFYLTLATWPTFYATSSGDLLTVTDQAHRWILERIETVPSPNDPRYYYIRSLETGKYISAETTVDVNGFETFRVVDEIGTTPSVCMWSLDRTSD